MLKMGEKGEHLKIRIKGEDSSIFSAIGFHQTEKWKDLKISDKIDIVYTMDINEFNGNREIQLKIVDLKIK